MTRFLVAILVTALACTSRGAPAGFTGIHVENVTAEVGTPGCFVTYRLFALFDDPADQMTAMGAGGDAGTPFSLQITGSEIVNDPDHMFAGLMGEDFPSVVGSAWDSYFAMGPFNDDTYYSPLFAGSDGKNAVLVGSELFEPGPGVWFDAEPGTPANGGMVRIMQLTVDPSECVTIEMSCVAFWLVGGVQQDEANAPFSLSLACGPCAGDADGSGGVGFDDLLLVLSSWGPCDETCCRADLNRDGMIGFDDLLEVLSNWNHDCAPVKGSGVFVAVSSLGSSAVHLATKTPDPFTSATEDSRPL